MASFDARLRLVGQSGLPLGVEIDITGERLVVMTGPQLLADWPLHEITISTRADGLHVEAEGEEIVLNVPDERRFMVELRQVGKWPGNGPEPV